MDDWKWRAWVGHPAGGKLGAAFLVTETRLLTCAHTVHGLEEARVGFPGGEEDLPVTVLRCTDWRQPGDLGDVAVLELRRPVRPAPAPLAAPAGARASAAGREFGVCGFPRRKDGDERHATVRTSPVWSRRNEWWELRATEGALEKGFSGSAVYDLSTGEVIGMVSDAELRDGGRTDLGSMLPIEQIRRYWEELDDLLPLPWLTAPARRELRALLDGAPFTQALNAELNAVIGRPLDEGFRSVWHSVRHMAEGFREEQLVRYLRVLHRHLPEPAARRLSDWSRRHLPEAAPAPRGARSELPSVIVRLERLTHGDFDVTVHLWIDGAAGRSRRTENVAKQRVQQVVEASVAELAPALFEREWMIEFAVPQKWLSTPFELWYTNPPRRTIPMRRYPVVVRDVQRLRPDSFERDQAYQRWRRLSAMGRTDPQRVPCDTPRSGKHFHNLIEANIDYCVLVYGSRPSDNWLTAALNNGVPVMLWTRTRCNADTHEQCRGHSILDELAEAIRDAPPDELPQLVHELRRAAVGVPKDKPHCGRDLTLLWDDPSRLPDPPLAMEV
ncbi:VMAP-C domain-containing protein [Actinomadura monticuli]|uniref:Trypsin-like peptidase domain-containing protein n=1 Tax=Actinomadura monticuli TaxID=3097367 RepID=A0ABV4QFJ1_9ACTN